MSPAYAAGRVGGVDADFNGDRVTDTAFADPLATLSGENAERCERSGASVTATDRHFSVGASGECTTTAALARAVPATGAA
ncbi:MULTISPECIES: hypothetical protein [unclassified Streptomyces]|uniref:hypothetical protein n=1 Tax=unclassified Streptomyces TaxID=2593676 RepID=UPI0033A7C79F